MFQLLLTTLFLSLIHLNHSFPFHYDFDHPFIFSSFSGNIISITADTNSNFNVLFSNGDISSFTTNFNPIYNISTSPLITPTNIKFSTTTPSLQSYYDLNNILVTNNISFLRYLVWNSTNYP